MLSPVASGVRRDLFVEGSPRSSSSSSSSRRGASEPHSPHSCGHELILPHAANFTASTCCDDLSTTRPVASQTANQPSPFLSLSTAAWIPEDAIPSPRNSTAQYPRNKSRQQHHTATAPQSSSHKFSRFSPRNHEDSSPSPSSSPTPDSDASGLGLGAGSEEQECLKATALMKRLVSSFQSLEVLPEELQTLGELGHGAFATVEHCMYLPQQKEVAVKRMRRWKERDIRDMFKEITLLKKIRSPYVVHYFGSGVAETVVEADPKADPKPGVESDKVTKQLPFLVLEYMNGGSLEDVVERCIQSKRASDSYSMQDAVQWLLDVARGLQQLHASTPMVIHRDIKLANILVQKPANGERSCAKITDFGLAALLEPDEKLLAASPSFPRHSVAVMRPSLTGAARNFTGGPLGVARISDARSMRSVESVDVESGLKVRLASVASEARQVQWTELARKREPASADRQDQLLGVKVHSRNGHFTALVGTWIYMAPEAFRNEKYDEKVDVHSFAVVMYELMHRYCMSMAMASAADYKVFARRVATQNYRPPVNEDLPSRIQALIHRCWHPQAAVRPSMAEVVESLLLIQKTVNWQHLEDVTRGRSKQDCGCCIS